MSPAGHPASSRSRHIDVALWVLAGVSAASTVWLSLGPAPSGAASIPLSDKWLHACAYAVTTLLFLLAAVWRPHRGPGPAAGLAPVMIGVIVASGLVVEILQGAMTEHREPELGDWIADSVGVVVAVSIHATARRLSSVRSAPNHRHSATSD